MLRKGTQEPRVSAWKRYIYQLIGSEISTLARFCDRTVQFAPLPQDSGVLLDSIDCPAKSSATVLPELPDQTADENGRLLVVLNGNLNYSHDVQDLLAQMRSRLSRNSRVAVVVYNPYLSWLYQLATWLGLRTAPRIDTMLRETDLLALCRLAGFEIVRIRPTVFVPFWIPLLGALLNELLPVIPLIRRLSFAWVVILRPTMGSSATKSLSIVIPARNERGNIENAIKRLPNFSGASVEVIFVEGHSTDGTWEEIQRLLPVYGERLRVSAYQQQGRGKNDAVRLGFSRATMDLVTILDADLTMPPEMLPRFYLAYQQGHGEFINGNRLTYPMEGEAMRFLNRLGNSFFAKALSAVLGMRIGDSLCGTKLLARRDYERIVAWRQRFGDFDPFGDFELLFGAAELALGVTDLPVRYAARTYGQTNISRFRDGYQLLRMTIIGFFRVKLGKTR